MDRTLHRTHSCGRRESAIQDQGIIDCRKLRARAARLAARACIDPGRSAGRVESGDRTGPRQRGAMLRARRRGALDPAARRLPRGKHPVDRERAALRRSRRRAHGSGAAGSLDAALGRPARDDAAAFRPACGLRGLHALRAARAAPARGATHAAADPLLRVARAPLGRSGVSRRISLVRDAALLAGPDPRAARADCRDGRGTAQRVTARRFRAVTIASPSAESRRSTSGWRGLSSRMTYSTDMKSRIRRLYSFMALVGTLSLPLADAAEDRSWVERSDGISAIVFESLGPFQPEQASSLGLERFDTAALDLKPGRVTLSEAAAHGVLQRLAALRKAERDPR